MPPLRSILAALADRPDVAGVALVSDEGLVVEAVLPAGVDADAAAALAATAVRALRGLGDAVGHGAGRSAVVEGATGALVLERLPSGATLLLLAADDGDLGALLYDLRRHLPALLPLV